MFKQRGACTVQSIGDWGEGCLTLSVCDVPTDRASSCPPTQRSRLAFLNLHSYLQGPRRSTGLRSRIRRKLCSAPEPSGRTTWPQDTLSSFLWGFAASFKTRHPGVVRFPSSHTAPEGMITDRPHRKGADEMLERETKQRRG